MQQIHKISKRWGNGNPFINYESDKPNESETEVEKKYWEKVEREKKSDRTKVFLTPAGPQPEKFTPLYIQEPRDDKDISEQEKHSLVSLAILLNDEGIKKTGRKHLQRYSWKNETTLRSDFTLKVTHHYALKTLLDLLDTNYKGLWKSATLYNNLWKKKAMLHFKEFQGCVTPDNKPIYRWDTEMNEVLCSWELNFLDKVIFTLPKELLLHHISENKKYKKLQSRIYK